VTNLINLDLKQKHSQIGNVIDGSHPYALHKISQTTQRPIIFVTHDHLSNNLYEEISFLNPNTLYFPAWDTPPYDLVSPSKEILQQRIKTLTEIIKNNGNKRILVTSISSILQKTITSTTLKKYIKTLNTNKNFNREELIEFLQNINYRRTSTTNEPGEFSVRGSILDLFINGDPYPHRIDFFGNTIDSIKIFDPETQITLESKKELNIIPTSELILNSEYIASFKESLLKRAGAKAYESELLENLEESIKPNAIEQWLPLFYPLSSVLEYFNEPIIILDKFLEKSTSHFFDKLIYCYETRKKSLSQPNIILPPEELWTTEILYKNTLEESGTVSFELSKNQKTDLDVISVEDFRISSNKTNTDKFDNLANYIRNHYKKQKNIIISASTNGSLERIKAILSQHDIFCKYSKDIPQEFNAHTTIILSAIKHGYSCSEYTLVTESDIFGQSLQNFRKKSTATKNTHNELSSFSIGELVVHNEYGIGRFLGLETVELSNTRHDCIKIEYSDNNKLFIPVENINLITRYGSDSENVSLDSLGSSSWQIKKAKAKEKIKESAKYLMTIAAQRQLKLAEILEIDLGLYEEFCTTFQYVETEDQENAINAVIADLGSGKAMDRLVCGDTGFGKTEVAIRAAFITIKSGKQVALICPTTLLANQHFKTFKARLEKFQISVALLSRLVSQKQSKQTIENINDGKVNLVIGTHALLNNKIKFQDLGLLIIDEEQHFGVEQKEKLKLFKENIHVLTLSATPIPRTLQMSLVGIRDLSIISTPPINRNATKNIIMKFDEFIIKDALLKERTRHGQSFYICPRITDLETIENFTSKNYSGT
jgi:transcription-repair coupling factor (superfamily II helicase)